MIPSGEMREDDVADQHPIWRNSNRVVFLEQVAEDAD
jgi:hypothetical protein